MSRRYDWLVVGAGFTGAVVAERLARGLDQRVLVIDRRGHVGGNAHDRRDEGGRLIHSLWPARLSHQQRADLRLSEPVHGLATL